jgi:hypothetical protein
MMVKSRMMIFFFCNLISFAICTSTFSKLCKQRVQWHVEECSVAFLCNKWVQGLLWLLGIKLTN